MNIDRNTRIGRLVNNMDLIMGTAAGTEPAAYCFSLENTIMRYCHNITVSLNNCEWSADQNHGNDKKTGLPYSGNPAISNKRPVVFRPRFAAGLAFSVIANRECISIII